MFISRIYGNSRETIIRYCYELEQDLMYLTILPRLNAGGTVMVELIKRYVLRYLGGGQADVPLEVGNEGKLVVEVVPKKAEEVLTVLRETREGRDAEIVGEATGEFSMVAMETVVGGKGY